MFQNKSPAPLCSRFPKGNVSRQRHVVPYIKYPWRSLVPYYCCDYRGCTFCNSTTYYLFHVYKVRKLDLLSAQAEKTRCPPSSVNRLHPFSRAISCLVLLDRRKFFGPVSQPKWTQAEVKKVRDANIPLPENDELQCHGRFSALQVKYLMNRASESSEHLRREHSTAVKRQVATRES